MLKTALAGPEIKLTSLDIKGLRFSAEDWKWAIHGANELKDEGKPEPETANTIAR